MDHQLKMMLTGIFLALASIWCLLFGSGNLLFGLLGGIALPILALLCFLVGFTGNRAEESNEYPTVPQDGETKEL